MSLADKRVTHLYTQRDDYPQAPATQSCLAGLALKGPAGVEEELNFLFPLISTPHSSAKPLTGCRSARRLTKCSLSGPRPFRAGTGI